MEMGRGVVFSRPSIALGEIGGEEKLCLLLV